MTDWPEAIKILNKGGVAVIPTDTIYGIVARAENINAVKKIHSLKSRSGNKPFIILISDTNQLKKFGIGTEWLDKTDGYWPGRNSLIFPVTDEKYDYLTCGLDSLAFRLPDMPELITLIDKTGPLVAPSANPESQPPADNIIQAREYFGQNVDIYIDGGDLAERAPSQLIDLRSGQHLR